MFSDSANRLLKGFETNLFGPINLTRSLLPHFREKRKGIILFMSSIGAYTGAVGAGTYSATKGALEGTSLLVVFSAVVSSILPCWHWKSPRHGGLSSRRGLTLRYRVLPPHTRLLSNGNLRSDKHQIWTAQHLRLCRVQ